MEMQVQNDGPITDDGKSSDQILADIEKEMEKQAGSSKDPEPAKPSDATPPEPKDPKPEDDKPVENASTSDADEVTVPPGESDKAVKEWMEKKGFKSTSDMARSLRNLERKLHSRERSPSTERRQQPPQPNYPAPAYQPPPPADNIPSNQMEELARRYNMDPEDLRKVAPLAMDIASNVASSQLQPLVNEVTRLNRKIAREAEITRLENDPAYKNPEVQMEMYKILEERPDLFQSQPDTYDYAFREALGNIARRKLEGVNNPAGPSVLSGPAGNRPPGTARGSGSPRGGSAGKTAFGKMTPKEFAGLPSAEMEKLLEKAGALPEEGI